MAMQIMQGFLRKTGLWLKLGQMRMRADGGNKLLCLCFAACSAVLSACGFLPQPHTVPMPAVQDRQTGQTPAKRLIVMLPGLYDAGNDFVREGFVKDLRARGINADVIIPEAHYGYYEARDVDVRLEADIFAPARARGYQEIWIVGVSLGGLGSLLYSAKYPEAISGILLIAPFPGTDKVLAEIKQAGGARAWSSTPQALGGEERYALRWLATTTVMQHRKAEDAVRHPDIFMGTGTSDRLIEGQRILSELLPSARVNFVEGGHDWATWRVIWRNFLDNGPWALEAAKQAHLDKIKL